MRMPQTRPLPQKSRHHIELPPEPSWLSHLRAKHAEDGMLYVADAIWRFEIYNGRWPTRRDLVNSTRHRFSSPAAMDEALDLLDSAWHLNREIGCNIVCGAPVFKMRIQNLRGPASFYFGFHPLPCRIAETTAPLVGMGGTGYRMVSRLEWVALEQAMKKPKALFHDPVTALRDTMTYLSNGEGR